MEELLITLIGIARGIFIFLMVASVILALIYNRFNDEIYDIKQTLIEMKKLLKEHFEKENKQDK